VAGVAREVLLERMPELAERDVAAAEVAGAAALVAINAVRGALPIRAVGDAALGAEPGARLAQQMARILEAAG
jgi:branched-subunit amino acid aminotransferase/4-amino-4-deoxychorismate lyase